MFKSLVCNYIESIFSLKISAPNYGKRERKTLLTVGVSLFFFAGWINDFLFARLSRQQH
jgi:hypothetical protein